MKILVIGCGVIGQRVAEASEDLASLKKVYLYDADKTQSQALASKLDRAEAVDSVEEVADKVHFAVEAAAQEAVIKYAPLLLEKGVPLLVMSVGALADNDFRVNLDQIALANNSKIYIPSGAIAGLDGLLSLKEAGLKSVHITTSKPLGAIKTTNWVQQKGIELSKTEPTIVFEGNARDAVKAFPRSINVAAALSIAGLGFDDTKVTFISDPALDRNIHRIDVEGNAGSIHIECRNLPSPDNPRTSFLAALSAVAAVHRLDWGFRFV